MRQPASTRSASSPARPSCRRAGAGWRSCPGRGSGGDAVEVGQQGRPVGVVEDRPRVVAVVPGGGGEHDASGAGGDEAASARSTPGSGSWPGSCSTTGTNPPTASGRARRRARASSAGRRAGSRRGRTRWRPGRRSRISPSTVAGSSWWPQPGTSQTPQEIGAPAMRSARGGVWCSLVRLPGSRPGRPGGLRAGTARTPRRPEGRQGVVDRAGLGLPARDLDRTRSARRVGGRKRSMKAVCAGRPGSRRRPRRTAAAAGRRARRRRVPFEPSTSRRTS